MNRGLTWVLVHGFSISDKPAYRGDQSMIFASLISKHPLNTLSLANIDFFLNYFNLVFQKNFIESSKNKNSIEKNCINLGIVENSRHIYNYFKKAQTQSFLDSNLVLKKSTHS